MVVIGLQNANAEDLLMYFIMNDENFKANLISLLSENKLYELTNRLQLVVLSPSPLERGWGEVMWSKINAGNGFK